MDIVLKYLRFKLVMSEQVIFYILLHVQKKGKIE
jgi:hypothetical protein